jgi:threonine/homoserine/homoserine lactone efflux protein
MRPITESDIRRSFVNCSKGEAKRLGGAVSRLPGGGGAVSMLSLVWTLIDMVWYLSLIWLAGRAGRAFTRPSVRRRIEQASGVVLVGLGLRLAAESR